MKVNFVKMHGCGNDYIFIDLFDFPAYETPLSIFQNKDLSSTKDGKSKSEKKIQHFNKIVNSENIEFLQFVQKISNRHFGVGGDGVVLILPSKVADAKMKMFNADGSEGDMCGNAIRCVCKFLYESRNIRNDNLRIETNAGIKNCFLEVLQNKVVSVRVDMGKPIFATKLIPVDLQDGLGEKIILKRKVNFEDFSFQISCVSMGNPHCVVFYDDLEKLDIENFGKKIENSKYFPNRTNVEFVKVVDEKNIEVRVWERGSGETLACGTGACAAVAVCEKLNLIDYRDAVSVKLKGGVLNISFCDGEIYLQGECEKAFEGEIEI